MFLIARECQIKQVEMKAPQVNPKCSGLPIGQHLPVMMFYAPPSNSAGLPTQLVSWVSFGESVSLGVSSLRCPTCGTCAEHAERVQNAKKPAEALHVFSQQRPRHLQAEHLPEGQQRSEGQWRVHQSLASLAVKGLFAGENKRAGFNGGTFQHRLKRGGHPPHTHLGTFQLASAIEVSSY